ncbi:hypothetical protein FACS189455_4740 [Bacteroidia bacterium]|nr:hypothetical protein FACS189455_4740 [Bacteroidia bacterium]
MNTKFFIPLIILYLTSQGVISAQESNKKESIRKGLSDEKLMDLVEKQTFNYFWDGAEPASGLACERVHMDGDYPQKDKTVKTSYLLLHRKIRTFKSQFF